jgi:hypothetical protein
VLHRQIGSSVRFTPEDVSLPRIAGLVSHDGNRIPAKATACHIDANQMTQTISFLCRLDLAQGRLL